MKKFIQGFLLLASLIALCFLTYALSHTYLGFSIMRLIGVLLLIGFAMTFQELTTL